MLYKNDEVVKIKGTGASIDGECGIIKGVASVYVGGVMYIVDLCETEARFDDNKYDCVVLPSACLELV